MLLSTITALGKTNILSCFYEGQRLVSMLAGRKNKAVQNRNGKKMALNELQWFGCNYRTEQCTFREGRGGVADPMGI